MKCDDVQEQLTAYLDGELADDRGSAVRGHLRSCDACRGVATDESALRDGLRELPPVHPPASLWANVQAQLATAEVADAQKPAWRRTLGRWAKMFAPSWPTFALGGVAAAAVVTFVVWRSQGSQESEPVRTDVTNVAKVTPPVTPPPPVAQDHGDVTADLAGEATRVTDSYADAAEELLALANEERARWSTAERDTFDGHVADLRREIESAVDGRPKQKAWRTLIRYLQNAAIRDEVALASGGAR
jgi:negative regulator of sigma E activity